MNRLSTAYTQALIKMGGPGVLDGTLQSYRNETDRVPIGIAYLEAVTGKKAVSEAAPQNDADYRES